MGLDLNMDFLGGLAQKSNYANLMAQKQQAAEANKARELQYAGALNNLQERDTNTALNFLQQQDKAEQDLANLPISEYDKKKLMEQELELRNKHITPLVDKYKGNVLEMLKSDEGKTATMHYMNALKSNPNIQSYKRDALIQSENEKRALMGLEPLAVYRLETKQWYNPEEQIQAKEAGLIPNLDPHPFVKQKEFSAMKHFQNLYPPTDKMDEYYKKSGRMPVSPDIYATEVMANNYPEIPVNTPRYQHYFDSAKQFYQKQDTPLYYKIPTNTEELAKARQEAELRGWEYKHSVTQADKDANKNGNTDFAAMPFSDISVLNNGQGGTYKVDLVGAQKSMPLLPSDVTTTAVEFYTPSNRRIAGANDPNAPGTEVLEQGRTLTNAKVKIPKDYKVVLLPVGDDKTPNPYAKSTYRIFVTATSSEGGDPENGYVPFSVAEPMILKTGQTYTSLYNELIQVINANGAQAGTPHIPMFGNVTPKQMESAPAMQTEEKTPPPQSKVKYSFLRSDGKVGVIDLDVKDEAEFLKAHPKAQKR